jgi:hypothetical protein
MPAALVAVALLVAPAHALEDGEDRQLTFTGSISDINDRAADPAVATDPETGMSLVVYTVAVEGGFEWEVFGQRIDAAGAPVGPALDLTTINADADNTPDAFLVFPEPAVAYSETSDTWLVVFMIDTPSASWANDKFEVFARTVTREGSVGASRIRVSQTGLDSDVEDDGEHPHVAWNPDRDEFLVAWSSKLESAEGDQIQVQRMSPAGGLIGGNVDISDTEAQDGGEWRTMKPGVAYDRDAHRWLVVWFAEPSPGDSFREQEVFGQLLDGQVAGVSEVGPDDFRISFTGAEDDESANAGFPNLSGTNPPPRVTCDAAAQRYLVTYNGDPGAAEGLPPDEYEVWLQRVTPDGARDGDVIRVSETGPDSSTGHGGSLPEVGYDPVARESLVVFSAEPRSGGMADNEFDVFGQRLIGGLPAGSDFRIAQTGPDGEELTDGTNPAVSAMGGRYQVVWNGNPTFFKTEIHGDQAHVPVVSVGDLIAGEGDGLARFPLTVEHADPAGVPVAVSVAGPGGTDLLAAPASAEVPAGASAATIDVPIVQDAEIEGNELHALSVSSPSAALLGDAEGVLTLFDDDVPGLPGPPGLPGLPGPGGAGATVPAALQVRHARVRRGRLRVRGSIARQATGALRVAFTSAGRTTRFAYPLARRAGSIAINRRLPRRQRRRRVGRLTLSYAGNGTVLADAVRVLAAPRAAGLRIASVAVSGGRLAIAGTINRRARGRVRIAIGGQVLRARIRPRRGRRRARWSARGALTPSALAAGRLDVLFGGHARRRVAGQRISRALGR